MADVALETRASRQYLTGLCQILDTRFSEEELRTLCFDLDVDYDSLPGEGKAAKARELVSYLERHNRIPDLVELGEERRPDISWEDIPKETEIVGVTDIEFVNREDELHRLQVERLRASRSPYTLVGAPAGYGKSYLLQRLVSIVESDATLRQRWCVRYVDFGPTKTFDPGAQIAHVVHSITGSAAQNGRDMVVDQVCHAVLQELSTPLPDGRRAVLLIFDAVERLNEESRQWLSTLLNDLYRRAYLGHQEIITVRVIIAGRNVEQFWERYEQAYPKPPAPRRINLSPFDEHPVQELIWNRARAARVDLDDQMIGQISDEVQYLSGGHPTVICSLVDDLANQSFAIGSAGEYFARYRGRLVQTCLLPVADDLLESLETEVREAVQTLSVFRRVNANTVQALVKAGALPPETNEIDLLGDMQRAHLLDGPGIRQPFYRDRLMRRILALNMAYGSRETRSQYRRLNEIAIDLYGSWIHNLGQGLPDSPLKETQRLLSVVEWLFHALQDEEMDKDELYSGLEGHVRVLSGGSQLPFVADLIANEIRGDAEVRYLLCHRLGDDGVSTVCDWLQFV